jgi:hypothetical protein
MVAFLIGAVLGAVCGGLLTQRERTTRWAAPVFAVLIAAALGVAMLQSGDVQRAAAGVAAGACVAIVAATLIKGSRAARGSGSEQRLPL